MSFNLKKYFLGNDLRLSGVLLVLLALFLQVSILFWFVEFKMFLSQCWSWSHSWWFLAVCSSFVWQFQGLPWWSSNKESTCQCRGHGFDSWSGKIPHAATTESHMHTEPMIHNRKRHHNEKPALHNRVAPTHHH